MPCEHFGSAMKQLKIGEIKFLRPNVHGENCKIEGFYSIQKSIILMGHVVQFHLLKHYSNRFPVHGKIL